MKKIFLFILLLCLPGKFIFGQVKIDKDYYIELLRQGNYNKVYTDMIALQKKPYGTCCLSDYFLAKSLCLSGFKNPAENRYSNILKDYKLSNEARKFIENEKNDCVNPDEIVTGETSSLVNFTLPVSSVTGKLGEVYNCFQSYEPAKTIKKIEDSEFVSRIFPLNNKQLALAKTKSIVPANYLTEIQDRFILVTSKVKPIAADKKKAFIKDLSKTMRFYSRYYGLREPENILTVYLLNDNNQLREIAEHIHGVDIPKENYGYSSLNDMSLLSVYNFLGIGTLKHELFHIMVRADIGNIPAWLDEGIATLYEESHWQHDTLVSNNTFWRNKTLKSALKGFHLFSRTPGLETLLNYSWADFEGTEHGDICKASVNYAYAKHLIVYLEKTGKLQAVVNAYKNNATEDKNELVLSNAAKFEKAVGMDSGINYIEQQFDKWLIKAYGISCLDPIHHGAHYDPGLAAFVELKSKLKEANALYASLEKKDKNEAEELNSKLTGIKNKADAELTFFDKELSDYFQGKRKTFNGIHMDGEQMAMAMSESLFDRIRKITGDLHELLRLYKKD